MIRKQKFIGIMTGTSLDGIDISLGEFWDNGSPDYSNPYNLYIPFDKDIKELLSTLNYDLTLQKYGGVQTYYSELIADAINVFIETFNINPVEVIAAGIHGQTVWHEIEGYKINHKIMMFSLQLINAPLIANRTSIPVIFDFRNADIANGGEGAPLVPIFDSAFFASNQERALINIGGISNITYLSKNIEKSIAFDCGPGNTWIDIIMQDYFGESFDFDGKSASIGKINEELLNNLQKLPFLKQVPPKSTGKELFSKDVLFKFIAQSEIEEKYDILATISYFTAFCINDSIKRFIPDTEEILISGGGAKNSFIVNCIKDELPNIKILDFKDFNLDPDFKESLAFAYLAYLNYNNIIPEFKHFTGAYKNSVLGSIVYP